MVLRDLAWHGRMFTVSIGRHKSVVTLGRGAPPPVSTPAGRRLVRFGQPLTLATARPDLTATQDLIRCGAAVASSSRPGAPALAAVDGSTATDWQPVSLPATLTAPLHGLRNVGKVVVTWGRTWPPAPKKPNTRPPGPVTIDRPARYLLLVSGNGHRWLEVAAVQGRTGATDTLTFPAIKARYVRLRIIPASNSGAPMLDELRAGG